jgi:hypothetical protein
MSLSVFEIHWSFILCLLACMLQPPVCLILVQHGHHAVRPMTLVPRYDLRVNNRSLTEWVAFEVQHTHTFDLEIGAASALTTLWACLFVALHVMDEGNMGDFLAMIDLHIDNPNDMPIGWCRCVELSRLCFWTILLLQGYAFYGLLLRRDAPLVLSELTRPLAVRLGALFALTRTTELDARRCRLFHGVALCAYVWFAAWPTLGTLMGALWLVLDGLLVFAHTGDNGTKAVVAFNGRLFYLATTNSLLLAGGLLYPTYFLTW